MDQKTKLKLQFLSAWCGPAFLVTFIVFWVILGHNFPNPSPALSPTELAARYAGNTGQIRLGFILSMIMVCLYLPWCSYLSARISQMEGGFPTLANLQLIGGALTVTVVSFSACFWAIAAFRPERNPELIQFSTDAGWLIIDLQYTCTTLQMFAFAVAVLCDRKSREAGTPLMPNWACYLSIFCGISFFPASLTGVLQTGPFAWNGVMSYYFPYFCWLGWESMTSAFMIKDIRRRMKEAELAEAGSVQVPETVGS